jgi:hypothetical protein
MTIERVQKDNRKLQNTLDSIPPERKGTAEEIILTEDLRKAFPRDVLEEKRVGEEMTDTIQTIVTENGERIATQILWDRKTGDTTPLDIKKAKRYKEKYNTDYCILWILSLLLVSNIVRISFPCLKTSQSCRYFVASSDIHTSLDILVLAYSFRT